MSPEERMNEMDEAMSEMTPQEVAALMEAGQKVMFAYDGFDTFALMAVADRAGPCLNPDGLSLTFH